MAIPNQNDHNEEIIRHFQLQFYQQQSRIVKTIVACIHQNRMEIFRSLENTKQNLDTEYITLIADLKSKKALKDRAQFVNQSACKQQLNQRNGDINNVNEQKQAPDTTQSNAVVNTEHIARSDDSSDIQIKQEPIPYLEPFMEPNDDTQSNPVPQAFYCAICDRVFSSDEALHKDVNQHILSHYCLKCNRKYSTISSSSNTTTCRSCTFISDYYESNKLQCDRCSFVTINKQENKSHRASVHSCVDCPICLQTFNTQQRSRALLDADLHSRQTCADCNAKYGEKSKQTNACGDKHQHVVDHIGGLKRLQCKYCEYMTVIQSNYQHHLLSHNEPTNKGKSAAASGRMINGRKGKQDDVYHYPKHPCPHCSYIARSNNHLETHIRTHTNEKPFKCEHPDCDRAFKTRFQRNEHSNIHTGKKPFKCEYCDLAFSKSWRKCKHMKDEHTGWKCKYCHSVFEKERLLTRHRNDKHKDKKMKYSYPRSNLFEYECKGCSRRFKTNQEMQEHSAECEKEVSRLNTLKNTNTKKKKKNKRIRHDVMDVNKPAKKKRKFMLKIPRRNKKESNV